MIRTVIIGSGEIAHTRHIPNLLRSRLGYLHGVYNRNYQHSKQDAKSFGCKAYTSMEEIWTDEAVDSVIVCVPASAHYEYVLAALDAKKHVLCEKPMAISTKQAEEMIEAEYRSGKKLMISYNQRYYQPHMKAKELLDQGAVGTVLNVRSCLGLPLTLDYNSPEDSNAASEMLSHRIDLLHYWLGTKVEGVFARLTQANDKCVNRKVDLGDDTAMAIIAYQNGVMASLVASRLSNNFNDRTTRIFGTKGCLTLYGQKAPVTLELVNGEVIYYHLPHVPSQREVEKTEINEAFFQCIANNTAPPISSRDGMEVMRVVEAVYKSNREERFIYI